MFFLTFAVKTNIRTCTACACSNNHTKRRCKMSGALEFIMRTDYWSVHMIMKLWYYIHRRQHRFLPFLPNFKCTRQHQYNMYAMWQYVHVSLRCSSKALKNNQQNPPLPGSTGDLLRASLLLLFIIPGREKPSLPFAICRGRNKNRGREGEKRSRRLTGEKATEADERIGGGRRRSRGCAAPPRR